MIEMYVCVCAFISVGLLILLAIISKCAGMLFVRVECRLEQVSGN